METITIEVHGQRVDLPAAVDRRFRLKVFPEELLPVILEARRQRKMEDLKVLLREIGTEPIVKRKGGRPPGSKFGWIARPKKRHRIKL